VVWCVNFSLRRAYHLEKNGAVQVHRLGLEMHGRAKPAKRLIFVIFYSE
jgi:hypothetical protein